MKYKRILLKLSGESLSTTNFGTNFDKVLEICQEIKEVKEQLNIQIAIVVGGGNYWRGRTNNQMDRTTADNIGMLATIMNALTLKEAFRQLNVKSNVQSAIEINKIADFYNQEKTINYLEEGQIIIFAGGTSNPFFSTDTASSLRAAEIKADAILKATNVDGLYDKDPKKYPDAKFIKETTYQEVLEQNLQVMDLTAITMCKENNIPILIYNANTKGNLYQILANQTIGSIVKD